jgi:hypothetical protein
MEIVNLFIKHISYDSSSSLVCSSCINFHPFLSSFHSSWILKLLLDKAFGRWVLLKFQWPKSSKDINKSILKHYFSNLIKTLQNKICSPWFMFLIYSYVTIQFGISLHTLCFHSYFCFCLVLGSTIFVCGILHLSNNFYFFYCKIVFYSIKFAKCWRKIVLYCHV